MSTPAELRQQLNDAYNRRDWPRTYRLATEMLAHVPEMADAHYAAGVASLETRQLSPAVHHLERAARLVPDRAGFGLQFAKALQLANRVPQATIEADRVAALSPTDPAILDALGGIFANLNAPDSAHAAYLQAVMLAPEHPGYRYNLATALVALGRADDAEREIEICLAAEPGFWRAHLTLAHLRKQTPEHHHLPRLEGLLTEHAFEPFAQMCLHMALAKEKEDLREFPSAFDHLAKGKHIARKNIDYSFEQDRTVFSAIERAFPRTVASVSGNPSNEPIFVFGMPRSGTTLVERILSSHPDVTMAGELTNFGMALRRAWGQRPPIWNDPDIAALPWHEVGANYIESTRPVTGRTPRFVDKFPFNFLHAGFIAQALPNAKMICLRRHPMDTCLANYRQLFAEKLPYYNYSFDLLDIGRYYILFDHLMAHWQRVIPGRILQVSYETLVDQQEATSRRIIEWCDLPWNDACLDFQDNPTPVTTASALQVRQPIYRTALGYWKNYEPQLAELQQLLVDAGVDLDPND